MRFTCWSKFIIVNVILFEIFNTVDLYELYVKPNLATYPLSFTSLFVILFGLFVLLNCTQITLLNSNSAGSLIPLIIGFYFTHSTLNYFSCKFWFNQKFCHIGIFRNVRYLMAYCFIRFTFKFKFFYRLYLTNHCTLINETFDDYLFHDTIPHLLFNTLFNLSDFEVFPSKTWNLLINGRNDGIIWWPFITVFLVFLIARNITLLISSNTNNIINSYLIAL